MTAHTDFWDLFSMATTWQPLIYANQNAPKPPLPFVSMQLTATNPLPVHRGDIDDFGDRDVSAHFPLTAQLQFYGEGCWEEATRTALMLRTVEVQAKAESLNIGINSLNQIQDIPALLDGSFYEPRAVFTADVSYTFTVSEYTSFIETVQGTYVLPGADRTFTATVVV